MKRSLFIILAFALLISGCSTVGLVYRNADWYLQHKIKGYTSFNDSQKETIRKDVSDYMRWHQKFALPEYILFLQNLNGAAQYEGRIKVETVTQLRMQLMDLFRTTMGPTVQPAALLFRSMDQAQIKQLEKSFAEDIREQRKDRLSDSQEENLDKRAENTLDFVEWLAGNLNKDQKQKIREMSRRLPFITTIFIQNREANQRKLIALLNAHARTEEIAAFLSSWVLTPEKTRTSEQMRAFETFEKGTDEMIVQIHGMLTTRQKEHIHETITSYIKDMRSISKDVPAAISASGK